MIIVQINSHYNQSGAGKIVKELHKYYEINGQNTHVFYGRGKTTTHNNVMKLSNTIGVYTHVAKARILGLNGYSSKLSTRKIVDKLEAIKPDIIHLHGLHGYYLNFKILFDFINKFNIPVVWTFHDCHAFTGNCGYHYDCDKYITQCEKCPYLKDYPKTMFFDRTKLMFSDKKELFTYTDNKIIVSPSEWMTSDAKKSFFGKYKCVTINNGINNKDIFYPRDYLKTREKYGFLENDKVVLGIAFGFDDPRKGVKYLVQMAKDLSQYNIKVILIGLTHNQSKTFDHLNNIISIPFTNNQDELAEYYSLSDIFILPSIAENYATVVLEAFACGTNVIGFNVGGVGEQLADRRGIVVEMGNQLALNNAVLDVFDNKIELRSSQELVEYINENNSVETMAKKYLEIYKNLLNIHQ